MTSMLSVQYLHYTAWPACYQYSTCTTLHDQHVISTVPAIHCVTSVLSVQYMCYTAWPACCHQYSTCTTLPAYHSSKFCLHYLLMLDNFTVPVDTCQKCGLPCWSLSFICLQNISQQHFLHLLLWYACSLNGTLHHHLTLLSLSMKILPTLCHVTTMLAAAGSYMSHRYRAINNAQHCLQLISNINHTHSLYGKNIPLLHSTTVCSC